MPEHIKIPAVPPRIQYVGNGVQTEFPFPFPIFEDENLRVELNAAPQTVGFAIDGAGATGGGTVRFDTAPASGVLVTLHRRLPIERLTDYIESGPLTARSLNTELDGLVAIAQQLADDQTRMLRYPDTDLPAGNVLPDRAARANRALVFDSAGNPSVAAIADGEALSTYLPNGAGAVARGIADKFGESVSVRDFGALGDGVTDDTLAVQAALAASQSVFVPPGTYRITGTIVVRYGQSLFGVGDASALVMDGEALDLVELPESYATVRSLRLDGGRAGIRLHGRLGPCVQNALVDLAIWRARWGLVLDGYTSPDRPCYWNNIARVLVVQPTEHGVWMLRSGAGDSPNANRFHMLRVYSLSAPTSGDGIRIDSGRFNNAFVDCEVNLSTTAQACVRVGADCDKTLFVNLYTESLAGLPNIVLSAGSVETAIINLFSASAGPAIWDFSGGAYTAVNAGYPEKNRLDRTRVRELVVEAMRYDTEFVEPPQGGVVALDLTSSCYLISAFGGPVEALLPDPALANGHAVTLKKTDLSNNPVTITAAAGPGPDGRPIVLASRYDHATVVSNGAGWWLVAHNLMPENAQFHEGQTLVRPDTARAVHLVSAFAGTVEARLPAPTAAQSIGRTLTLKKSDVSANTVRVTAEGGGGPDGEAVTLGSYGQAVTVFCDGNRWHVLSRG